MILSIVLATVAVVLPGSPDETEAFAAEELRHWVKEISGEDWTLGGEGGTKIYLGRACAERRFPKDVAALEGGFGYALRRSENGDCYLFGATPKGTLNAVYGFLERNSDIIWARPQFTVHSKLSAFRITDCDVLSRPKSTELSWLFTVAGSDERDLLWSARNGSSFVRIQNPKQSAFARRLGMKREKGGHVFTHVLDRGLFADHPEYWAELNGLRKASAPALCLTAKGLPEAYRDCLFRWIEKNRPFEILVLGMNDSWSTCACAECLKPIRLPDGTLLTKDDPSFASTRWFTFVNPLAEAVKAKYGLDTAIYGYFYLTRPPKVKIAEPITVIYHPVPRQMRNGYDRQNADGVCPDWNKLMDGYDRVRTKGLRLREYYGCVGVFPAPLEYVARDDARLCLRRGILEFSAETPVDHHDTRFGTDPEWNWDSHALSTWCTQRLWWDPDVDLEKLRDHFLRRAYHGAAAAMRRYYDRAGELWWKSERNDCAALNNTLARRCFLATGADAELRGYLVEAERASDHPVSRELVRRARASFEWLCGSAKRISMKRFDHVPTAADWENAAVFSDFEVFGHPERKASGSVSVKLLADGTNVYVRFIQPDAVAGDIVAARFTAKADGSAKAAMRLVRAEKAEPVWTVDLTVPLAEFRAESAVRSVYGNFYNRRGGANLTLRGLPFDNARFYPDIFLEDGE